VKYHSQNNDNRKKNSPELELGAALLQPFECKKKLRTLFFDDNLSELSLDVCGTTCYSLCFMESDR
jgi:hypothetical protein